MFTIKKENRGYFVGMVWQAECGWHAGFEPNIENKEIIKYSTLGQGGEQKAFLEEMFHENKLEIVEIE